METKIYSIIKEVKEYFIQIVKDQNDTGSLTSIQKEDYLNSLRKKYLSKEIGYSLNVVYGLAPNTSIGFYTTPWDVEDVGKITDVRIKGAFPISLKIDDNISIVYDPRDLNEGDRSKTYLENPKEFLHLNKNDLYKFKGKISHCTYQISPKGKEEFSFSIIGHESYSGSKKNSCFIATVCYENYDDPKVLVFRTFRDKKLLFSCWGKLFISIYYFIAPTIAKRIEHSKWLKRIIKKYLLDPLFKMITNRYRDIY